MKRRIRKAALNPFKVVKTRWSVWICFVMLLHLGLRRGELLALPVDAVKRERIDGRYRYWLDVRINPYQEDSRSSVPSIKTVSSIRQIPVTGKTAALIQLYIENYRGKPNHSYLINSTRNLPMSVEGLGKLLQQLSKSLPSSVQQIMEDRLHTRRISAHNLRHTCAVARLSQMLAAGTDMAESIQALRIYFGWSETSHMPQRYARAAFEHRLSSVWNDSFDDHIQFVRGLPG